MNHALLFDLVTDPLACGNEWLMNMLSFKINNVAVGVKGNKNDLAVNEKCERVGVRDSVVCVKTYDCTFSSVLFYSVPSLRTDHVQEKNFRKKMNEMNNSSERIRNKNKKELLI